MVGDGACYLLTNFMRTIKLSLDTEHWRTSTIFTANISLAFPIKKQSRLDEKM